jgi:hypothetical protein
VNAKPTGVALGNEQEMQQAGARHDADLASGRADAVSKTKQFFDVQECNGLLRY